jgi:hypothetical protein
MVGIVDASFLRNFFEGSIALVVEKQIRFSGHAPRAALHQNSLVPAEVRIVAKLRQVVDIDMHIARNEEVDMAIAIVICPSSTSAETARTHSGPCGYILELAVAQVVIKGIAAEASYVNILQAIIVIIGDGDPHAPTLVRKSGGVSDIGEMRIAVTGCAVLMIERDH